MCAPDHSCLAGEGDLRLFSRVDVNGFATGALQVFLDGAFGAVCVNLFDPADADVACRQMGFVGGTTIPLALKTTPYEEDYETMRQVLRTSHEGGPSWRGVVCMPEH